MAHLPNTIASIPKSNVSAIPALIIFNPVSSFLGFTIKRSVKVPSFKDAD